MRTVLFGGGNKGSVVLKTLLECGQEVIGVYSLKEDKHENIWYERVQDIAIANGIRVLSGQSLKEIKPDVVFVAGWRYRIPLEEYTVPPKGCIVLHDSLLPKYRGFAPMNWAIINGETETGVTMFFIDEDIDSGDIISYRVVDINMSDTAKTLEEKLSSLYIELLEENLPFIEEGIHGLPQDHSKATYTCKRVPEDGLIDWGKPSLQIHNLVRGLTYPYPGAFSYVDGSKVYIWKTRLETVHKNYVGKVCGRVVNILDGLGVEVLTGDGSLIVEDVGFEGDSRVFKADKVFGSIKKTFRCCR